MDHGLAGQLFLNALVVCADAVALARLCCKHGLLSASSSLVGITLAAGQHKVANLLIGLCFALGIFAQALILFLKTVDLSLLVTQLLLGLGLEKLLLFAHATLNLSTLHVEDLRLTKLVNHHVDDAILICGRQVSKAIHVAAVLLALFLTLALNAIQPGSYLIRRHAFGFQADGICAVKQIKFALVLYGRSSAVARHVNSGLLIAAKLVLDHLDQSFGVFLLQEPSLNSGLGQHIQTRRIGPNCTGKLLVCAVSVLSKDVLHILLVHALSG